MEKKAHKTSLISKDSQISDSNASGINGTVTTSSITSHLNQQHHHHQAQQSQHHHSHVHSHNHNITNKPRHRVNNNNGINHYNNTIIDVKSYPNGAPEHISSSTKTVSTRTKNEEAIHDLRHRIPDIENIFDVHSRIGNGTFSTVLLGTLKKDRELPEAMRRKFAIKHHIPTSHPDRIIKELKCMVEIGGTENVVGINCTIRHNESVAFIMPYMQHDRFHEFFNKMELAEVQCYMKNLFIALRRVHKFNVIHRDVKPSNFLYNRRKRQFLLVDFGLAQHVPQTASMPAIVAKSISDGKRAREQDETTSQQAVRGDTTAAGPVEVSGSVKRLRATGPQGDQQIPAAMANTTQIARIANNSALPNGSPFKMPLKQLNEISTPAGKTTTVVGSTNNGSVNIPGIYNTPVSRQMKSTLLGASVANRLQQKIRQSTGPGGTQSPCNAANDSANTPPANASVRMPQISNDSSAKYGTNRSVGVTNTSKCFCYGAPQVCNICLIKKEIHASRAGTPGYRPPEVLLKYPDQTTAVDVWAAGVILLSILSSVYPFFKAPNDYVALAEMVTIFGDKTIRKTAFVLDRLVTLSQKTKPLDLRKLCVRFRNRSKFSSPELLKKYQNSEGTCEVCKNCDQFYFNCLCAETHYSTEPLAEDDPFPASTYDLLYKLLEVNPHKRITAEEALEHPFFKEQPKETLKKPTRE